MVNAEFVRTMAQYSAWQNGAHLEACTALDASALAEDRGGFFGSIAATANHVLWADRIWLSRFAGTPAPTQSSIPTSIAETESWGEYVSGRRATDADISAWAREMTDTALLGDLTWYSGAVGRELTKPLALCVVHFFNHQTHHRGQIHGMLTAAGAKTTATDIVIMPGTE